MEKAQECMFWRFFSMTKKSNARKYPEEFVLGHKLAEERVKVSFSLYFKN